MLACAENGLCLLAVGGVSGSSVTVFAMASRAWLGAVQVLLLHCVHVAHLHEGGVVRDAAGGDGAAFVVRVEALSAARFELHGGDGDPGGEVPGPPLLGP